MKIPNSDVKATYLKDYRAPDFLVKAIDLHIELDVEKTIVRSFLKITRNSEQGMQSASLMLNGESLKLISIQLNEQILSSHQYEVLPTSLQIHDVPADFSLEIVTEINPGKNTALSGLYCSGNMFCTQCEAEGFRRITYYLDRPDVMAPFTTTLVADKTRYPVLLSNGNKVGEGQLNDNRHWVKWVDPYKKPSYLFALVAGDLAKLTDTYITQSGRRVALEIFTETENIDKCKYALHSLKNAMRWDEQTYGREYDLDIYMIVAANDFNMGAMENKGLNIFNSKYVLVSEETATDADFQNVEAVVGHEYFHNWTGNRITCRDWFQLSLKEGLTVFREQQFSADMNSPAVERIGDARILRTRQFAEDAGPMAHPVRPASYIEINNFYTSTVYNKGAEVIRMLRTLLGKIGFRKGMDLYFSRYDGQAVTIEDFVSSFQDANDIDLNQFKRWYHQAGTPIVKAKGDYYPQKKQFILTLSQSCKMSPDKLEKKPFLIPINIALYDVEGKAIPLTSNKLHKTEEESYILLQEESEEFIFENVERAPIPSLLRNFSAPVKLDYPYTHSELILLMISDSDLFNRWDATQRLNSEIIKSLMIDFEEKRALVIPGNLIEAYRKLLKQNVADPALTAQLLSLPSFQYIAEECAQVNVEPLIAARKALIDTFSTQLQTELEQCYLQSEQNDDGTFNNVNMGHRALKNTCLYYLVHAHSKWLSLAEKQYRSARNMTDTMGALAALNHSTNSLRDTLFEDFYSQWKKDALVVNKWLALHASSEIPNALDNIQKLLSHEAFDIRNPNKVYALISTFSMANPERFHQNGGAGYQFLADRIIEINKINPQVAARLLEGLTQYKRLDERHASWMKAALLKVQASGPLSDDVFEIVTKSLSL